MGRGKEPSFICGRGEKAWCQMQHPASGEASRGEQGGGELELGAEQRGTWL